MKEIKLSIIILVLLVALLVGGYSTVYANDEEPVEFFEGIDIITETLIDDFLDEIDETDEFDMGFNEEDEEVYNIAVADFLDQHNRTTHLSHYISEHMIINMINNDTSNLKVLERQRLNSILEEQDRMTSGVLKRETSEIIGELLGADALIIGNYYNLGREVQLIAKIVSIETGYIYSAVRITLNKNNTMHYLLGESYIDRTLN